MSGSEVIKVHGKTVLKSGMTLYDHLYELAGEEETKKVSKGIDTKKIKVICLLGKGSYASVFLVEKFDSESSSAYYAMKVLDKNMLKEKDYTSYVKVEASLLKSFCHPFILKLNYSF